MNPAEIKLEFAGPLGYSFRPTILRAATLVFSSIRKSRAPKRIIRVTVKELHPNRKSANPTGWTNCKREVILRISTDPRKYPAIWNQSYHPEWPRIQLRNPREAVLMLAAHEFAHLALRAEKMSNDRDYNSAPNFEEWLCENIAITSLQITRGIVLSSLI